MGSICDMLGKDRQSFTLTIKKKEKMFEDNKKFDDKFRRKTIIHRKIGTELGIIGGVLFNPYGGPDVYTQFGLANFSDVITTGIELFGNPNSIKRSLDIPSNLLNGFANEWYDFDAGRNLEKYHRISKSIGPIPISRIMNKLSVSDVNVVYFSISENGDVKYLPLDEVSLGANALVEYIDHQYIYKRLWYLRIPHDKENFPGLIEFLKDKYVGTTLIKGAWYTWHPKTAVQFYNNVIIPTKAINCLVVTDENLGEGIRPIWTNKFSPKALHVFEQNKIKFGYGKSIYFGPSCRLLDLNEFENNVFHD